MKTESEEIVSFIIVVVVLFGFVNITVFVQFQMFLSNNLSNHFNFTETPSSGIVSAIRQAAKKAAQ